MTKIIRLSRFVYGHLLVFYPRELRRRFGKEMVDVFEDLMCEVVHQRGVAGIVSLWGSDFGNC
jgi:hypothetical protein